MPTVAYLSSIYACFFIVFVHALPISYSSFSDSLDDLDYEIDSPLENSRPRCQAWNRNNFLIKQQLSSPLNKSSAEILVNPTYLDGSGWLKVSWKGVPAHLELLTFWIGVYLEGENVTETAPIKYLYGSLLSACAFFGQDLTRVLS